MKVLPLLLAVSLVANAALLTVNWRSSPGDAPPDGQITPARPFGAAPSAASGANGEARLSPAAAAIFADDNPEALRDLLRASGLPDDLVRAIVQMRVWKKYEARFKALNPQPSDFEAKQSWWKDDPSQVNGWNGNRSKAQRDEARRLQREVKEESERLLGVDPTQNRWQSQQFAFLAPEKRQALLDIQQDYQELINEVQQDTQGFRLASDGEKLRYLQAEQKRDMEALMSPAERQAYELRQSSTAQQLRVKMTALNATEQEYLKIFPLQKAFDELYNPQNSDPFGGGAERDQAYWKARQAAEAQLQAQIKAVVGEARYAESIRKQDNDWRQLEAATRRLTLPADTPARLYPLRDSTASAAQQIATNADLPAAQKKQALAELAAATRAQVRASLGSEGSEAYFKNNGMRWLKELEKGNTITFNANDSGWSTKSLPKEPQKAASP
ncbi:MAG: hypothetical protein H2172_10200 [Opitutus sp.]|nr:hypothetical protein [Opitutus sp.]MCS6247426.1 hypothetical protein [Opitutus sp.]MCS6273051.1 hypothetical protein [Opitutus sp.]MCS6276721.1 hypothetical protein [Opitutus sp.]MCS6301630.1 hypothetical protein [Opitutus sp.]